MPRYLYKCPKCEAQATYTKKVNKRKEPQYCLKCCTRMKLCIGPTSFRLKGRGWAKDGYDNVK